MFVKHIEGTRRESFSSGMESHVLPAVIGVDSMFVQSTGMFHREK